MFTYSRAFKNARIEENVDWNSTSGFEWLYVRLITYSVYSQIEATRFSASHLKVKKTSEHYSWKPKLPLLVAVMDAIVL